MADLNGYTSTYECRAGNTTDSQTNVNIADYVDPVAHPPGATITISDSLATIESKLNGNQYVDWTAGDYTGKGVITISSGGTSGARKVIRYYRASDDDDEPWNQSTSNKVRIRKLIVNADFCIFHRLSWVSTTSNTSDEYRIELRSADDNIFNRLLVEGRPTPGAPFYGAFGDNGSSVNRNTIQNSVIRENWGQSGSNATGIGFTADDIENNRIVNCEIYDWAEHLIQIGRNEGPDQPGWIIENCDCYHTNAFDEYGEDHISVKSSGSSSEPQRIIHNRIWRARWADESSEDGGGAGILVNHPDPTPGYSYLLIQDNVVSDCIYGTNAYPYASTRQSIVGNIFYNIHEFDGQNGNSGALLMHSSASEYYLNTIIDSDRIFNHDNAAATQSIKGNVFIDVDAIGTTPSGSSEVDYNVYYSTSNFSETNKITNTIATRDNSTAYSVGNIVRTTATAPADGTAGDYLYMCTAITTGISAVSPPTFPLNLGSSIVDGGVTWTAIRGPYSYYRKLLTGAEQVYIPYASIGTFAPEADYVPSTMAVTSNRGINNDQAAW